MIKLLITALILRNFQYIESLTLEEKITNEIFSGYNKQMTPSDNVNLFLDFSLRQISGIEERLQTITTDSYISIEWYDSRLEWNTTGVDKILVKASQVWLPEINVINSAESDGLLKIPDSTYTIISSKGKVNVIVNAILKTRCVMNLMKFPYDEHSCDIRITTWDIQSETSGRDLEVSEEFVLNPVWEVKKISGKNFGKGMMISNVGDYSKENLMYSVVVKRLALHYIMNGIFPNILLNLLLLLVFFLNYKAQVGTTLGLILTTSVYLLKFGGEVPVQADRSPYVVIYFAFCNVYNVVCLAWFILMARLMDKNYLPEWIEAICMNLRRVTKSDKYLEHDPKQHLEKCINILQYMFFILMFLFFLITNLCLWLLLSS